MAVQRFGSEVEITRRVAGWTIAIAALVFIAGLVRAAQILGGGFGVKVLVMLGVLAGFVFLGVRLARPRNFWEIDAAARTYSVVRDGTRAGSGPLEALGPLYVRRRARGFGESFHEISDLRRTIDYLVCAIVHSDLALYTTKTEAGARRKMESLAGAWRLRCQSLGGQERGPDELGVPLHQRLRDDAEARRETPLPAAGGVRIEPLSVGYAMRSTVRSWVPLGAMGGPVFVAAAVVGASWYYDGWSVPSTLLLLALLGILGRGVRDSFLPRTVTITDRGVTYRGSRMRFREIEEVVVTPKRSIRGMRDHTYQIEVIGHRSRLALGENFSSQEATREVAHELQRLIIEVAEANPHSRA